MTNQKSPRPAKSPLPVKAPKQTTVGFPEAMKMVSDGFAVTKLEWANKDIFVLLRNDKLQIKLADGLFHDLIVSRADMEGLDWVKLIDTDPTVP